MELSPIEEPTLQELKEFGFNFRSHKSIWTPEETEKMWDTYKLMATEKNWCHTKDKYYYISHHILNNSKNEEEVKKWMEKVEKKYKVNKETKTKPKKLSKTHWEVERIIQCIEEDNKTFYRVRWKGFTKKDDSWFEEKDLNNCSLLLKKFKENNH